MWLSFCFYWIALDYAMAFLLFTWKISLLVFEFFCLPDLKKDTECALGSFGRIDNSEILERSKLLTVEVMTSFSNLLAVILHLYFSVD